MIKKLLLFVISLCMISCVVHTKGENGKPGTPSKDTASNLTK